MTFTNRFADFSGGAVSYAVGASRRVQGTIRAHEQQVYEIDVPAGSASLVARAGKASDAGADLDVFVYDCSGKECRAAGASADPLVSSGARDEVVMIQNPAAGKWKVVVDAASVPSGSTTYDYVDVVFNQSFGMVAANDQPAKHAERVAVERADRRIGRGDSRGPHAVHGAAARGTRLSDRSVHDRSARAGASAPRRRQIAARAAREWLRHNATMAVSW